MTSPGSPAPAPQVLVPWADVAEQAPPGLPVAVYDALDPAFADRVDLGAVELYVMPYARPWALDLVDRLPALRALQVLTAGYDGVVGRLPPGVALHNGSGLHDASTAEHALALILAAQREIPRWVRAQDRADWDREFTRSLADCRVLVVGYGRIGRAIEQRLLPFETTVVRVARRARPDERVHAVDDLPALLPEADVVVLVLPDDPGTRGLIGPAALAAMKDDALLVNVGRGSAVDTGALLAQAGRVRAALDVTDPEPPPPDHPLWSAPGVLLTPHVAGGSATFRPRARRFVADQLRRWAAGEPLANPVTP